MWSLIRISQFQTHTHTLVTIKDVFSFLKRIEISHVFKNVQKWGPAGVPFCMIQGHLNIRFTVIWTYGSFQTWEGHLSNTWNLEGVGGRDRGMGLGVGTLGTSCGWGLGHWGHLSNTWDISGVGGRDRGHRDYSWDIGGITFDAPFDMINEHMSTYISIHLSLSLCLHVTHTYVHVCSCMLVYICMHAWMSTFYIYLNICICMSTYMHTHVHIRIIISIYACRCEHRHM